ncbi:GNAT family N-acetyltransferase [Pontibacillus yanchengensis]|uniref:N-acetyltransferase domain-containing protein n=1 Tax=Pontibacillus yanchengensis Y32 TaxID=1385514 RepID=A0A0A2TFQ3_9BACI|nr:GNAT family N-acetyltransferase [Pontibacillus yanchengensis]KGP74692.1 hypothetical protein N782_00565 [Pontibacillus yanchengensis Y32]
MEGVSVEAIEEMYSCDFGWVKVQEFNSDNPSLNRFLHQDAYYHSIEFEANTSLLISSENDIIGYFTLVRSSMDFPNIKVPCLEVAKLAVHLDYQQNGYGSYMIDVIKKVARQTNHRYITLDSLYSQWCWYYKHGFMYIKQEEIENESGYVYMYCDLYDENISNDFLEE